MAIQIDLVNKVAFVSGASSGLGRHFALTLARAGADVVCAARRADRLNELVQEIVLLGRRAIAVPMDVMEPASIAKGVELAESALGAVAILVNNAGTVIYKNATDYSVDDYDQVANTNERGAFLLSQAIARSMIRRGTGGKIINVASVSAYRGFKQLSVYSMSKAAILQMTRALCLEWARHDIQVNAIVPGYIQTEINAAVWDHPIGQRIRNALPRKRVGEPSDLDGALLLLASDFSRFMSGSAIVVDDGHSAVDLC